MPDTGSPFNLPYPVQADQADVPLDIEALAAQVAVVLANILDGDQAFTEVSFGDANLYRSAANVLQTDDDFIAAGLDASGNVVAQAGAAAKVWLGNRGPAQEAGIQFGSADDTNLYRSAANTLKTDDALIVGALPVVGSVRGHVSAAAAIVAGSGFTVAQVGGAGTYRLTFPGGTFAAAPLVLVHQVGPGIAMHHQIDPTGWSATQVNLRFYLQDAATLANAAFVFEAKPF